MVDKKVFTVNWKTDMEYDLYYRDKWIGEGMVPRDLVEEFVRLMNWAYDEGIANK